MKRRLLLDKPIPETMITGVQRSRIPPGAIIDEWSEGRGYVLVYTNVRKQSDTALIFVHGGGFTGLSPSESSYVYLAQRLCKNTGLTVIVPDYPLVPKQSYPKQPNDILAVRLAFEAEFKSFIIGSDSAGGAIAWSLLLRNGKAFDKAWFLSPWLNMRCDTASYLTREYCKSNGQGDRVFKGTAKEKKLEYIKVAKDYLGKDHRLSDPVANPFNSRSSDLAKFPQTLILVGDQDSIRDDGLTMAGKLQSCGVECYASVFDGMWHDWMLYSQRSCPKAGEAAYQKVENFMSGNLNTCDVPQSTVPSVNASIVLSTE